MSIEQPAVVVGASLAGLRVVEYLRKRGFEGEIVLLGDEPHLPYDRPPLSKKVLQERDLNVDDIALRTLPWDELHVDVRLGVRAVGLDADKRVVQTTDGDVAFGAAFLCTGVEAIRLPFQPDAPNVHVIRSWEDSVKLRDQLDVARNLVVVGGGFIGSEVAAVASARGISTTIVEMERTLMLRGLGARWGEYMEEVHRSNGVAVLTDAAVSSFKVEGDRVVAVELADGRALDADVVLVGCGARPATGWLDGTAVACDDGVLCDKFCETSVQGVYGVGDVARWFHDELDRETRVEHWTNADEMAKAAVHNFLNPDDRKPFTPVPMVWSDQYGARIQVAGELNTAGGEYEEQVRFGTVDGGDFVVLQIADDQLTGVLSINRASVLVRLKMLMERGAPLDRIMSFVDQQEARFLRAGRG